VEFVVLMAAVNMDESVADGVLAGFQDFMESFAAVTSRARQRFCARDWPGMQEDARERLDLYPAAVDRIVATVRQGHRGSPSPSGWAQAKRIYRDTTAAMKNGELARSFFNSVSRRIFAVVGQNPTLEFTRDQTDPRRGSLCTSEISMHVATPEDPLAVLALLERHEIAPYESRSTQAHRVEQAIGAALHRSLGHARIDQIQALTPVFYRGQGAFIVARILAGERWIPLVLALRHGADGVVVDAVLTDEDAVSVLFSFTRSYFHAAIDDYPGTIGFLQSLMPRKKTAELYMALGHHRHGKTALFRDLTAHLAGSTDQFVFAPGRRGMVMLVFTLPSYDLVFKVIRDHFQPPKTTDRNHVIENYRLVFQHDRAGRLIDAQEFAQLEFNRERFAPELLDALLNQAAETVHTLGDQVVFTHLYTERRVTPLDVYIEQADFYAASQAVLDYGHAIKDLAASGIFPGDIFLKNFGVTRHGRVVFYDYDELCLLNDCRFRAMPEPETPEQELSAEPWFAVADNDIFPAELSTFLGLYGRLREVFLSAHGDLFDAAYWQKIQEHHRAGELIDIIPYGETERLHRA